MKLSELSLSLLYVITILLVACDGGPSVSESTNAADPSKPSPAASVDFLRIDPEAVDLQAGQSQQFRVTALDSSGNPIPDLTYIFRVQGEAGRISSSGDFSAGTEPGIYNEAVYVEVIHGSAISRAAANITISPGPLDHVSLKPAILTAEVDQAQQFSAAAFDRYENSIPGLTYVFSAQADAGRIDGEGNFSAGTKAGTYTEAVAVEVNQGSLTKKAVAEITVTPGPLAQVEVLPANIVLAPGMQRQIVAKATDRYGNELPVSTLMWSVGNGGGTVDSEGIITAGTEIGTFEDTINAIAPQPNVTRIAGTVNVIPAKSIISAGFTHTCAVTQTGGAKCWGNNSRENVGGQGQLGDGTTRDRSSPVDVVGLSKGVIGVSAGGGHACALTRVGGVKCWGSNDYGQLGDGTTTDSSRPVDVVGLSEGVAAVSAGGFHTCALTRDGGIKCWGGNSGGQIGDDTITDRLTPQDVLGLTSGVEAIAAGGQHTCALTAAGGVKCWGVNTSGKLGIEADSRRVTEPMDVVGLSSGVITLSSGSFHTCAVTNSGKAKCWGFNSVGQLGDGTNTSRSTPVDVVELRGAKSVSAGWHHTCAVTVTGIVKCWGLNDDRQLGDGTSTRHSAPVQVVDGVNVAALAAAAGHTCALTIGGALKCWGANSYGELGDGTTTKRTGLVEIVGFTEDTAAVR